MFKRKRDLLEHLATIYEDLLIDIEKEKDPKMLKKKLESAERLHKLLFNSSSFSYDALIAAATNILGILLILNFEKLGALTSKAVAFVAKIRL